MTLSDYSQLKNMIVMAFCQLTSERHEKLLSMLKTLYEGEINSPRRFEQISTIGQLLEILELRDYLSEDNVQLLKHIAERCEENSDELLARIKDYQANHVPKENYNYYAQHNEPVQAVNSNIPCFVQPSNSNPSSFCQKEDRIFESILEDIGTDWKNLGRNLGIREGEIDQIDAENVTLYNKASALLAKYKKRRDAQRWFFLLCQALENARRKDKSRDIQDIMTMSI